MNPRWLLALIIFSSGCASPELLPHYPPMSVDETRLALAVRAKKIQTISAEAAIALTRADGQSIRLDGALAIRSPSSTRLRAWKMNQAVFDLTLTPDGLWLIAPENASHADEIRHASLTAGELTRCFSLLTGVFFQSPTLTCEDRGPILRFTDKVFDDATMSCDVVRRTLVPRSFTLTQQRAPRYRLILKNYSLLGDIPFPRQLNASTENEMMQIDLRHVELNTDLPPAVFTPPKRAEKLD